MQFEGPEKKLEIHVRPAFGSLRDLGRPFWNSVVIASRATILSEIANDHCTAYLLSESSLFVYDSKIIMITCGRTTLIKAALKILEAAPLDQIEFLSYERKDEHYPEMQYSSFDEDVEALKKHMPGQSMCLGDQNGRHVSLFYMAKSYTPDPLDLTVEILMHGIGAKATELFLTKAKTMGAEELRKRSGIHQILPDFIIDDFVFDPHGYSLNALSGPWYYTVHVTPEAPNAYISFETNYHCTDSNGNSCINQIIQRLTEVFEPQAYNLVFFHRKAVYTPAQTAYRLNWDLNANIGCGYHLQFFDFIHEDKELHNG